MSKKTDSKIAREQGVTRSAISDRRRKGWTEKEIAAGVRSRPRKNRYSTQITTVLGKPVDAVAEDLKISVSEVYRRYHLALKKKKLRDVGIGDLQ